MYFVDIAENEVYKLFFHPKKELIDSSSLAVQLFLRMLCNLWEIYIRIEQFRFVLLDSPGRLLVILCYKVWPKFKLLLLNILDIQD